MVKGEEVEGERQGWCLREEEDLKTYNKRNGSYENRVGRRGLRKGRSTIESTV